MSLILHSSYFMDVESLIHLFHSQSFQLDLGDSYVKQTYRSRCYIAAANGRLTLNIPIVHDGNGSSMMYRDVNIDHSQSWAINHLKSIVSAYKNSPYFEFYEASLRQLFADIPVKLMDWNLKTMQWLLNELQVEKPIEFSNDYLENNQATYLITAKKKSAHIFQKYMQVFQEKHGFQPSLSGLDLLFNLGPASRVYLRNEQIT